MNLLELINQDGHNLSKKTANEYAGPCPFCGGTDRFIVWPDRGGKGTFWCRQCGKSGDPIQYLMDKTGKDFIEAFIEYESVCGADHQQACVALKDKGYLGACIKYLIEKQGMDYDKACQYIDVDPEKIDTTQNKKPIAKSKPLTKPAFNPKETKPPADRWRMQAKAFLDQRRKRLMTDSEAEARCFLHDRGISDSTVKMARLGWNPKDVYRTREAWGLAAEINQTTGRPKKVYLPRGLVIPCFFNGRIVRLRIRRPEPGLKDRYRIIKGSATRPLILPCNDQGKGKTWVILESELDALLVHQEAGDLVGVIALGSAQLRPDTETDHLLKQAELILCCLDSDRAGANEAWGFWADTYKAERWPCIMGKDPGEMYQAGVDIRAWIQAGSQETGKDISAPCKTVQIKPGSQKTAEGKIVSGQKNNNPCQDKGKQKETIIRPFPGAWLKQYDEVTLERLAIMTVDGGFVDQEALKAMGL